MTTLKVGKYYQYKDDKRHIVKVVDILYRHRYVQVTVENVSSSSEGVTRLLLKPSTFEGNLLEIPENKIGCALLRTLKL